jgi:error-prone DNA polymerase
MPEPPLYSKRIPVWKLPVNGKANGRLSHPVGYAELHCKTNYSFLEGASHPDELAKRAADLGYTALAITDVNSLAGVVRAHVAAKAVGLKLLIGAEIRPEDAAPVLLYAPTLSAYRHLSRLITRGRRSAEKGESRLTFSDIAEHAEDLLAAVIPPSKEAGVAPGHLSRSDDLHQYRGIFRDRCHIAVSLHHEGDDEAEMDRYAGLARQARMPLVATNDVHYHDPGRRHLHDVVTAIRWGITVAEVGALRFPNGERHLKSPKEMAALFSRYPQALVQGVELAERCNFSLDELRYEYPEELCPAGLTPSKYLAQLTWKGADKRYPGGVPEKVLELCRRELSLIAELRYEAYFLTVWDLVEFARSRNILCQGRGSAANSAVCFCLGITSVDPDRTDVLFERFVSRERAEAPDIDVDFEHERREEVLQYVYQKYGRDRAGITAEVITYRPRSAIRDVGKALGLSLDRVDRLAKILDPYGDEDNLTERLREAGLDPESAAAIQLVRLSTELLGFPRHLSQHVGGFVITHGPLSELVPIENAAMPDRTVIQWDKDDLDALGILKVDCLALGMLTAIHKCFDLVAGHHGVELTLATVPAEDTAVYAMISRADTIGVFQIESRAQMSMLPRLLPRCFYDLVVEVAIVRPGPIQGGMVHPYLRRRSGLEPVTYPSPAVEEVLKKTLGVPLFQEQVMRLAMVAAGFTAGEADQLRRAMGAWRRPGLIEQFRAKLRDGMIRHGLPIEFADRLYEQIRGFGEYGFPEAHAASFALLAYVSAWLKCYYPAAFTAAILNSQPMGFYAPAQLVRDAQEHGVPVRPVDVNASDWDCTLEPDPQETGPALRLGFRLIKGLPQTAGQAIVASRGHPFQTVSEFARRTRLGRVVLQRLASADAFGSLGLNRREAFWHVLSAGDEEFPLFVGNQPEEETTPELVPMPLEQHVVADYNTVGLSLKAHPISLVRAELDLLKILPAAKLDQQRDKSVVRVAGLVTVRQKPATASGTIFVTIEDETGIVNLVVWRHISQRYRRIVRTASALVAQGRLERADGVTHLIVTHLEDLSDWLAALSSKSRDFR